MNPRTRDSILYLLAGLGTVCLCVYLAVKPPTHQIDSKWIEFALLNTAIFGLLVQAYWGYRKSARVWLTLFLILVLHIAVFSLILIRYDAHWPILVQVILFTVEGMILTAVMYWILGVIPYSRPR